MPAHKSMLKRMRTSAERAVANKTRRTPLWTFEKRFRQALDDGNLEDAQQLLNKTVSVYDKAVKANVIHKNRANRKKSRLNAALTAASSK
jgi:small subunit ribosomal protein S20